MNIFGREVGGGGKPKKPLQLVQRGTDTRIPLELVAQPSGEVLDLSRFERLSVKLFNDAGTDATPPTDIQDNHLIVEVTADISQTLGTGVYSVEVTGRVADTAFADGYHDYTVCTALCRVTSDGSDASPTKVTANVIEVLKGKDGKSAYEIAVKHGYTGTEEDWAKSLTPNGGAVGGGNGKSTYELAVQEGYQGTLQEWLKSLVGKDGEDAYEVAKKAGYAGSREEWLKTLIGATGLSAYELAKSEGYEGSLSEWLASLKGADGDNAYKVAVRNGYVGDEHAWLASLRGADGEDAYEVAKAGGYQGSREAWLESLKGETGKSAYELAKEAQNFTGTLTDYLASLKGVNGKSAYQSYLDTTTDDPKLTEKEWATLNATTTQFLYRINKGKAAPMNEQALSADQLLELQGNLIELANAMSKFGVVIDTRDVSIRSIIEDVKRSDVNQKLIVYKEDLFRDYPGEHLPPLILNRQVSFFSMFKHSSIVELPAISNIELMTSLVDFIRDSPAIRRVVLPSLQFVRDASNAMKSCASLEEVKIGDLMECTVLDDAVSNSPKLRSVEIGVCPKVERIHGLAYECFALESIRIGLAGKLLDINESFYGCSNLRTIEGTIDVSLVARISNTTFKSCTSLEEVRIKGLKADLDLSACANLSVESVRHLVENLQQATGKNITLARSWQQAHTEEAKSYAQIAAAKGFALTFR